MPASDAANSATYDATTTDSSVTTEKSVLLTGISLRADASAIAATCGASRSSAWNTSAPRDLPRPAGVAARIPALPEALADDGPQPDSGHG